MHDPRSLRHRRAHRIPVADLDPGPDRAVHSAEEPHLFRRRAAARRLRGRHRVPRPALRRTAPRNRRQHERPRRRARARSGATAPHREAVARQGAAARNRYLILRDRPRLAVVVDGDEGEGRIRHLVAMMGAKPHRPGLDVNLHRGAADALHIGEHLQHVADPHRLQERHRIDRHGDDTAARPLHPGDAAGLVHPRHHPAAEDIAIGIGVRRHGDHPHGQRAARRRLFAHSLSPRRSAPS